MTNDDLNRKIEFLVEWQAQFAADIQALKERQEAFEREQVRLHEDVLLLRESANTALELSVRISDGVTQLFEMQAATQRQMAETDRRFAETDRRFAETDRRFAETDRRIARVAGLIEAHVREHHTPGDESAN